MRQVALEFDNMAVIEWFESHIVRSPDATAQAEALAVAVARELTAAIRHRGRARIAFSGGSTPARFFERLAGQDVDWSRVDVTLVDERCVDMSDERSNARLLHNRLIGAVSPQPEFFPLFVPGESEEARDARFAHLALPFDVVHLGMGQDAHTASFFPDAPNIEAMLDPNQERDLMETQSAASRERRVTWSLAALLRTRSVVVQLVGARKWQVLAEALDVLAHGNVTQDEYCRLPILAVLAHTQLGKPDGVPCRIHFANE